MNEKLLVPEISERRDDYGNKNRELVFGKSLCQID